MADILKDLLLFWKRGIGIYLAMLVVTYLIGVVTGVGTEVWNTLTRAVSLGGILTITLTWVVNPIISGWVASMVVKKIVK